MKLSIIIPVYNEGKTILKVIGRIEKIRLKNIHKITETITASRTSQINPSDFDLSYLGSIEANTTILEKENKEQIYSLVDHKSSIDSRDYNFLFSNSFLS